MYIYQRDYTLAEKNNSSQCDFPVMYIDDRIIVTVYCSAGAEPIIEQASEEKKMQTTIAAISTAMSASGIGIIRISGENAMDVISRIYRSKGGKKKIKEVPTHTIHYGYIYDGEELIDEVLVMIMHAPRTFTGEDTVEIDCHGGVYAMQRVLDTVLKNGAEIAEPGEFTKRAFLNGRMDLSQAEAVMDVIQAEK